MGYHLRFNYFISYNWQNKKDLRTGFGNCFAYVNRAIDENTIKVLEKEIDKNNNNDDTFHVISNYKFVGFKWYKTKQESWEKLSEIIYTFSDKKYVIGVIK